ncbi:hypothetical protein [Hoylesella buccalis]|uniref:hypothetical protein n=1 Tax=Hoylesella buccalis TaxID=28127 RepID=UPI0009E07996|nr:hypothetical protein [Hoylesella buccalis]
MTELNAKTITKHLSVSTRDKSNDDHEKMQFYYHPDHLGSSSYITDFNPLNLNPYAYCYQSPTSSSDI